MRKIAKGLRRNLIAAGYHSRPAFIVIGAQKSGTTALFEILSQHPQVVPPRQKELHFFDGDRIPYGDFTAYHENFPLPHEIGRRRITFEATPSYLYHPDCARRIADYAPDLVLVLLLREPVSRAYSAWNMYRSFTHSDNPYHRSLTEDRTFEEAVRQELSELETACWDNNPVSYLRRGFYSEQIEKYLQFFPRESLLIFSHGEFLRRPQECLARICRSLSIDDSFDFNCRPRSSLPYEVNIAPGLYNQLQAVFQPQNEQLFSLLGRNIEW